MFYIRRVFVSKYLKIRLDKVRELNLSLMIKVSGKKIPLTLFCFILAIAQLAAFITYVSKTATIPSFADLSQILMYSYAVTGTSAFVDVSIATVMVTLLFRSRSGLKKSNSVIGKVIAYTINTGLICGACEVFALISALVWPEDFIYVGFVMVLPKCNLIPCILHSTLIIPFRSVSELYACDVSSIFS